MNCANSFCFYVYLILHACAARFDVTGNLEKFCELNKALFCGKTGSLLSTILINTPTPLQTVDILVLTCFVFFWYGSTWLFHASTEGSKEETIADKIQTPENITNTVE